MMDMMADCLGGGMWVMMVGMGLFGLLVLIVLVLAAAALVKYLLAGRRPRSRAPESSGVSEGLREPGSRADARPSDRDGHASPRP